MMPQAPDGGPSERGDGDGLRGAVLAVGRLAVPITVGVGVLTLCLLLRMAPRDAAVAALTAFGVTVVLRVLDKGEEHPWTAAPEADPDGSRRDVARLTWTLVGRDGRVSEAAVRRLRADARRRLARAGVVLPPTFATDGAGTDALPGGGPEDPSAAVRARALLGEPAWAVLTGTGGWLPTLAEVEACVVAVERLGPPTAVAGPPPAVASRPPPARPAPPGTTPDGRTTS